MINGEEEDGNPRGEDKNENVNKSEGESDAEWGGREERELFFFSNLETFNFFFAN